MRVGAWIAIAAIAVLSLLPGSSRPHTGAGGITEHLVAYCGTALLLALGYRHWRRLLIVAALSGYAAVLELLRTAVPGRHASIRDVLWGALGAIAGVSLASLRKKS